MLKKILNIIIVLIILAILFFVGIFAYDMIRKYQTTEDNEEIEDVIDEVSDFLDDYLETIEQANNVSSTTNTNDSETSGGSSSTTSKKKVAKQIQYKEYSIIGKIVIDKIKLSYPILNESTVVSLKRSITKQYGVNPNEKGNMVLAGHNYRNGTMFSNLKKMAVGDIVKIIDLSGTTIEYEIYEIYETTPNDSAHLIQDTSIRHLVLTTCTNDNQRRVILKCKEKLS